MASFPGLTAHAKDYSFLHHHLVHYGRELVGQSRCHDVVTYSGIWLPVASRVVIFFIAEVRSQWAEQFQNWNFGKHIHVVSKI